MNSSKSDQELSAYQFFTRHCILNGMSMEDASVLWNSNFKNKSMNKNDLILQLAEYFKEYKIVTPTDKDRRISTFLLTWNPLRYSWDDIDDCIKKIETHGHFNRYWSCGRSKKPKPGDRFFLLRQKIEPRGIVASGYITSEPYVDSSPHNKSGWSRYVKIVYDIILKPDPTHPEKILRRHRLDDPEFSKANWNAQGSGIQIPGEVAAKLDYEWRKLTGTDSPGHINMLSYFIEGARQEIHTTSYERNPKARTACIEAHGYSCAVCGFNFEEVFGEIGKSYIHVHHLRHLSEINNEYVVDPVNDLKPVCPNCHAMLHRSTDEGFISIEDLKEIIEQNSQQKPGADAEKIAVFREDPR